MKRFTLLLFSRYQMQNDLQMLPMRSKSRITIIKEVDLTSRSNWMLNWTMPGPLVLTGIVGLRLPIIARGVLPKDKIVPFQLSLVFCLFLCDMMWKSNQLILVKSQ